MKSPYEIIKSPLITEKLQDKQAKGIYGFWVDIGANKIEISQAINKIYNVKVTKVNIINMPAKRRRLRFKEGYTSAWKKAIVRLKTGQSINIA